MSTHGPLQTVVTTFMLLQIVLSIPALPQVVVSIPALPQVVVSNLMPLFLGLSMPLK